MPISTSNIIASLRKRKKYGLYPLGSFEVNAKRFVGPDSKVRINNDFIETNKNDSDTLFVVDQLSGRLVYKG